MRGEVILLVFSALFMSVQSHCRDLLQCYNSNSSSSPEDECLTEREFRSVYLVTYSQADVAKFPTCEVFVRAIVESFSTGTQKSFSVLSGKA